MGNTTLIELNHDQFYEIEDNKELFVEQILNQFRAGNDFEQEIIGGKVIAFFHRDRLSKKCCAWERFKHKWMNKKDNKLC